MWLEIGNLNAKFVRGTEAERIWLIEYLSFDDATARYRPGGRSKSAAELRVKMFNVLNDTFPSGFIQPVKKAAKEEGMQVDIVDRRTAPTAPDLSADLTWLRDYQIESVNIGVKRARGIFWLPTGAGKTEIAIGLSRILPCRWVFLVHRASLMGQTADRYETRTGLPAGRIGEGVWSIPTDSTFVVATFQTLHTMLTDLRQRAIDLLHDAEGLMIDECHVLPADSFWRVAMSTGNAYYRYGFSGTPLARGDRRSLLAIAATGPVIHRIKPEVLISRGILSRPKVRVLTVMQAPSAPTWAGVYKQAITTSPKRNSTVVDAVRRATKPCLVFVKEVAHGKALTNMLLRAGVRAEFTFGTHSTDYRKSMVSRLVRADLDALVCSVIFQEGIDIPELRSVVVASGGRSVIATLQRLGRGMRVERDAAGNVVPGGDEFEVYDIADRGHKWLDRHTKERLHAYAGEGFQTIVEQTTIAGVVETVLPPRS